MSLAIAIKSGDTVFVGADSLISNGSLIGIAKDESGKLWKVADTGVVFAHAGGIINSNIVATSDEIISKDFADRTINFKDVVTNIVPNIFSALEGRGRIHKEDHSMCSCFILAHRDRIFCISGDGNVIEPSEDYVSIGGGAELADGAFEAIKDDDRLTPQQKIAKIISCACTRHAYVGYPIRIINTTNDDEIVIKNEDEANRFTVGA